VDEGPLPPFPAMSNVPNMQDIGVKCKYDMTTFDEHLEERSKAFMDKAKREN
jgi:arylsulfatase